MSNTELTVSRRVYDATREASFQQAYIIGFVESCIKQAINDIKLGRIDFALTALNIAAARIKQDERR